MIQPQVPETCQPLILTDKEERILEAVRDLGYVTAQDIKHLLFSEGSLSHVQATLAKLSEGNDSEEGDHLLYRFHLPITTKGTKQYVYALGAKGREAMGKEGYFRPYKLRSLSYSHIAHHLTLTRFVCSGLLWCQYDQQVRLADVRLFHELARELGKAETATKGSPAPAPVVPDGWLHFELLDGENGDLMTSLPILLEIDGGSEYRRRFKQHIADRIEFIRSEKYARFFGVGAVRIAYATTGSRPEFRQSRLAAMRTWTKEVLADLKLKGWENVFYFTDLVYEDIYNLKHFSDEVWYTPTDKEPKLLLDSNPHGLDCPQTDRENANA
jgi:hypothetical protein